MVLKSFKPWPTAPRTEACRPIGVTSSAIVLPGWSSERPPHVPISGWGGEPRLHHRGPAHREALGPPAGVGTRKVTAPWPRAGSAARTRSRSTRVAAYLVGAMRVLPPLGRKSGIGRYIDPSPREVLVAASADVRAGTSAAASSRADSAASRRTTRDMDEIPSEPGPSLGQRGTRT